MIFLLNIVFGLLAAYLTDFVLARVGVSDPVKVIIAIVVGILVFLANLASQVVHN